MVRIIGGGFTALTLAEQLALKAIPFQIFESSSRLGGLIQTKKLKSGLAETAANGLLDCDELRALASRMGLELLEPLPAAKKKWIYSKGRPRSLPLSLGSIFKLVAFAFKLKYFPKSIQIQADEKLKDYSNRILNSEIAKQVLKPALTGVYGPSFEELSAELILGKYFDRNRKKRKIRTLSFAGGLQSLITALEHSASLSGQIFLNQKVKLSDFNLKDGPVIICSGLATLGYVTDALQGSPLQTSHLAMKGLTSVTLFTNETDRDLQGFGCLFADLDPKETCLGVLINSSVFTERCPKGTRSETWILNSNLCESWTDSKIVQHCLNFRSNHQIGFGKNLIEFSVTRWPQAIPVFSVELKNWLHSVGEFGEKYFGEKPIRLHGNYMGEIGLSAILDRSKILANRIQEML